MVQTPTETVAKRVPARTVRNAGPELEREERAAARQPATKNGAVTKRVPAGTCPQCGQKVHKGRPRPGNELWNIVTVTPAMAKEWLEHNHRNRAMVPSRVMQYAQILSRGEWLLTNDSLCFDEDGGLLNGQHRLGAVIEADTPARFGVIWGLDQAAQDVMDGGLPRRLADALKLRGYSSWHHLAAAIKFLHRYNYIASVNGATANYGNPGDAPVTRQSLNLLDQNPHIVDFIAPIRMVSKRLKVRSGMGSAIYYKMAMACTPKGAAVLDTSEPDAFFDQLLTLTMPYGHSGERINIPVNSPVRQLERWLQRQRDEKPRALDTTEAAYICKAWNLWIRGETVQALTWHGLGGKRTGKEKFPLILGPTT